MKNGKDLKPLKNITDEGALALMEAILEQMKDDYHIGREQERIEGNSRRMKELRKSIFKDNGTWFLNESPENIWEMLETQHKKTLYGSGYAERYLREALIILAMQGHLKYPGKTRSIETSIEEIPAAFGLSELATSFLITRGYLKLEDRSYLTGRQATRFSHRCKRADHVAKHIKEALQEYQRREDKE